MGATTRILRATIGTSLDDMAQAIGVTSPTLAGFERGETALPPEVLGKLRAELAAVAPATAAPAKACRCSVRKGGRGPQKMGSCVRCQAPMPMNRRDRLFCSGRCRQAAHRTGGVDRPDTPGSVVYFLGRGDHVKIGRTVDLVKRMQAFQQRPDDVLLTIPGGAREEARWHHRFAHLRDDSAYGGREWFRLDSELRKAMESARGGQ